MEFSSYDDLLKQVDNLRVENSNLRKELEDNSNHLCKLENEASTMKEVLTHLHDRMDSSENEQMATETTRNGIPDNRQSNGRCIENDLSEHNPGSLQAQVVQLERERTRILQDIEMEEKEKQWFLACMERINQQLLQLSHDNGYITQADHTLKQQLERDAECLRETMQQKLGTRGEMHRREEARIHSICLIEKEIKKLYQQQDNSNDYVNCDLDTDLLNEKSMTDLCEENESKRGEQSGEFKMSSKMTTSATQTMDMFASESTSPPPPTSDEDVSNLASIYHGSWPLDKVLWHSGPSSLGGPTSINSFHNQDTGSVTSFKSNAGLGASYRSRSNTQQLGTKVEMVYSLLSMLGSHDKDDMSRKLLSMSSSVDSCIAMRQSGCLPLLVELLHGDDKDGEAEGRRPTRETRQRASQALHNVVHSHPDDKRGRREARVLRLLEQIRDYCGGLRDFDSGSDEDQTSPEAVITDKHPIPAMAMLMKLSFDEEHRHAMCQLGGLQAIAELVQVDYETHGNLNDQYCITLRRYAGMALTNLTFGDGTNKALLCSMRPFMRALVAQLHSPSEDLRQVIASVVRNLSWRADQASKKTLREVGAVATLMRASMDAKKESTLKSILSALWNLSAHCSMNKAEICAVEGALAFLVGTLTYKSPSNTHAIVENGGGILRNISSHIAVREDYRCMLRQHNCLQILLQHLRSPSLTIVSNACGTLWNLSARCTEDQQSLWDMGAVGMLRNLVHSKHKMISMGSSAALKNLLSAKPGGLASSNDKYSKSGAPSLLVRKQKALEAELDHNLAETCENLDSPKTSPTHHRSDPEPRFNNFRGNHILHNQAVDRGCYPLGTPYQLHGRMYHSVGGQLPPKYVARSESKDSIVSTQSDSSHDRLGNLNILLRHRQEQGACHERLQSTLTGATPDVLESRIQYVMQEVTRQIALENEIIKNEPSTKGTCYLKPSSTLSKVVHGQLHSTPESDKFVKSSSPSNNITGQDDVTTNSHQNTIFDKYSNLTSMIENLNLDDSDSRYQPVDYSLKYSEESSQSVGNNRLSEGAAKPRLVSKIDNHISNKLYAGHSDSEQKHRFGKSTLKQTNVDWQGTNSQLADNNYKLNTEPIIYGNYAETDLDGPDQPTNFSLRYTEDTDTTDAFQAPAPQEGSPYLTHEYGAKEPSFHDDTMMTYCTEDTPLNFSTATSLSDLRDLKEVTAPIGNDDSISKDRSDKKDNAEKKLRTEIRIKNSESLTERSGNHCSLDGEKPPSSVSSVDKPVTYCVEDTPGCLSRLSPLSSIHSTEASDHHYDGEEVPSDVSREFGEKDTDVSEEVFAKVEGERNEDIDQSANDNATKVELKGTEVQKTVTFGEDHFAEETPLMFSRCSSLGSLSSFDQHSIHDDRSSVISDFSRRASEVVSPSDLPDSPGQTCPSSPRPGRAPVAFTSKIPRESILQSRFTRPVPAKKTASVSDTINSVFEDAPRVYLDEGTPLEFSKGTSLSSLPFGDDSVKSMDDHGFDCGDENAKDDDNKTDSPESSPSENYEELDSTSPVDESLQNDNAPEKVVTSEDQSDDEDNEDDILAACINSAMPNNSRHDKQKHNNTKLSSKLNVLGGSARLRSSFIPVKSNNLKLGCPPSIPPQGSSASCMVATANALCKPNNKLQHSDNNSLKPNEYNNKNSEPGACGHDSSSDTSSVFDDDPEKILAQCIRSGMPKSNHSGSGRHAGNLLEQQFDNCSSKSDKAHYNKPQFCHVSPQPRHSAVSNIAPKLREPFTAEDTLTVFAEEGTPANISNATSLSNLTIDSIDVSQDIKINSFERLANKTADFENQNGRQQCSKINNGSDLANSSTTSTHSTCATLGTIQEAGARVCNVTEPMISNDTLKQYAEEGTPSCLSRGFSLSSLSIADTDVSGQDTCDAVCVGGGGGGGDTSMQFPVEDTPVCFSQNSSLSSLSVESLCVEPSPSEQALLEECISSGMPKSYSSKDKPKQKSRKLRGSLLPCAVGGSVKHMSHSKGITKMECVVEKPMSPTPETPYDGCETKNEEESDGASLIPVEKNLQCTAVATDDPIDTTAGSTEKVDIDVVNIDALNSDDHSVAKDCNEIKTHVLDSACRQDSDEQNNIETGSLLILMEATKVVVEVQKEVKGLSEEMEQSLVSQCSDMIDNVNPPSVMGDLSCSMISSGASDSLGRKSSVDSAPINHLSDQQQVGRGRFVSQRSKIVPELVMRALADGTTSNIAKQQSMDASVETLSMRSNVVSDIIDNVKPPSIMEDLDMSSSTYSVCSIVSEVADSKSEGISNDDGSVGSDVMFKCLKSVVAMAEMYARDSNMVASGRSGFSVSEIIENVNPPSTLLEITDSVKDCTEVATDTLENNNDTDVEDDLPADPEPLQPWDESPEEQLSDEDNEKQQFERYDDRQFSRKQIESCSKHGNVVDLNEGRDLYITPEEVLVLREDANLVLSTLNELQLQDYSAEESLFDDLIECETLSLVSNGSDSLSSDRSESRDSVPNSPIIQRGPRIIKPINRDSMRWNTNNQEEKSIPKGIRGKRKSLYPRQQIISSCSTTRFSSLTKKEMVVKPTRTSALRATQSQQKVVSGSRLPTDCTPTRSPSLKKISQPNEVKVIRPLGKIVQNGHMEEVQNFSDGKQQGPRPKPPIKQGTFTKEKPSQNAPPKISPSKTRIPTFGRVSSSVEHQTFQQHKEERPPHGATGRSTSRSKLTVSRSLDDSNSTQRTSQRSITKVANNEPKVIQSNRVLSRRGQSSSPVQRSLSNSIGSARGTSSIGVRNSPSTHSLGSSGSSSKRNVPLNSQVSLLNGTLSDAKRSSSNGSLCSNTSSSTSNSRKSLSGSSVVKKDVKSRVSSLWKSGGKTTKMSSSAEAKAATPKEGMSRSSTYEKLPTFECSLIPHHCADEGSEKHKGDIMKENSEMNVKKEETSSKSSFVKKGTRALAEARLQKWLARKARLVAKRDAETSQDSDEPSEQSGMAEGENSSPDTSVATSAARQSSCIIVDGANELPVTSNYNSTEAKMPAAAIVTPFNYTPSSQIPVSVSRSSGKVLHRSLIPTLNHVAVSPTVRQQDVCFHIGETNKIEDSKQPSLVTTA